MRTTPPRGSVPAISFTTCGRSGSTVTFCVSLSRPRVYAPTTSVRAWPTEWSCTRIGWPGAVIGSSTDITTPVASGRGSGKPVRAAVAPGPPMSATAAFDTGTPVRMGAYTPAGASSFSHARAPSFGV